MSELRQSERLDGKLKLHREATFGEVSNTPLTPKGPEILPFGHVGTAFAINDPKSGVAAHLPDRIGRGGARNRADRESYALTAAQIANLTAAKRHAGLIGLPFTRMITIHWGAAGVPLADMAGATGHFLDLLSKALARHGSGTTWIWVHENGDGKGGHCHILAYVPAALVTVVTALQLGWLRKITGRPYLKRVIHSKPIGGRLGLEAGNPELHGINLDAALSYVLKGASPEAASEFALVRLEPGGRVVGKRCGTSQNIGAKARKKCNAEIDLMLTASDRRTSNWKYR